MDRYTRWAALLELLARDERVSVHDAARALAVSAATVRRDFDALAKERKIVRLRGGALRSAGPAAAGRFDAQLTPAPPHARRICGQAAALVHPGMVVGLTGSAFTAHVGRAVGVRFDASTAAGARPAAVPAPRRAPGASPPETPADDVRRWGPGVTVVTNDLAVATELARRPGLKVVATGGVLSPSSMMTGPLAGLLLRGVSLDMVIVSSHAVDPDFGVTAADEVEAECSAAMIARAREVVVVARSADLDRSAFARVCGAERIDTLVTDIDIAPSTAERFGNRGVRVVTA